MRTLKTLASSGSPHSCTDKHTCTDNCHAIPTLISIHLLSLGRLLGPRRKLFLALAELREREAEGAEGGGGVPEGGKGRKTSRSQLKKQPSTELQAAYQQVSGVSL